ncbi:hypothetical protein M8J77_015219 [Diaphorina citri]|nr:hypothetical protein M8J77_015219 [Diaphorina citri]
MAQVIEEPERKKGTVRFGTVLPNEKVEDEDFDPFDRHIEVPTANWETYIHFIKGSIGTGCLAMPSGFKSVGYLPGLFFGVFTGALTMMTLHLLMQIKYDVSKKMKYHVVQFPDVCELVMMEGPPSLRWLAKPLPIIVDFFIFWNHLGICCVYINFIADNFDQACHHFSPDTSLEKIHWELIITAVMIVLNQVKNLHFLSPFSSIGNILLTIGLGMVCYYIFRDGLDQPILRPGDVELFGKLYEVPLFMGTFLFASLGIGVLIALEDEMKTPSSYRKNPFGIFNMGFTTIIIIYLFVGVIGYYKYGQLVEGSITLNIPKDDPLAIIVRLIFAGVIIFTYPIHFYVSINIFWTNYVRWRFDTTDSTQALKLWIYEFVIRCVLVIVSLLVTILVKQLSFLISIVGSFCLPLLGFLVPGLLELTINLSTKQSTPISILKDVFLIIFGLFFFLTGTFMGVVQVLQEE